MIRSSRGIRRGGFNLGCDLQVWFAREWGERLTRTRRNLEPGRHLVPCAGEPLEADVAGRTRLRMTSGPPRPPSPGRGNTSAGWGAGVAEVSRSGGWDGVLGSEEGVGGGGASG